MNARQASQTELVGCSKSSLSKSASEHLGKESKTISNTVTYSNNKHKDKSVSRKSLAFKKIGLKSATKLYVSMALMSATSVFSKYYRAIFQCREGLTKHKKYKSLSPYNAKKVKEAI